MATERLASGFYFEEPKDQEKEVRGFGLAIMISFLGFQRAQRPRDKTELSTRLLPWSKAHFLTLNPLQQYSNASISKGRSFTKKDFLLAAKKLCIRFPSKLGLSSGVKFLQT